MRGQQKSFNSSLDSGRNFHVTVFYDDCQHELKPVTAGCRLVLVLHLVCKQPLALCTGHLDRPLYVDALNQLRSILSPWQHDSSAKQSLDLLAIPLDHYYGKER